MIQHPPPRQKPLPPQQALAPRGGSSGGGGVGTTTTTTAATSLKRKGGSRFKLPPKRTTASSSTTTSAATSTPQRKTAPAEAGTATGSSSVGDKLPSSSGHGSRRRGRFATPPTSPFVKTKTTATIASGRSSSKDEEGAPPATTTTASGPPVLQLATATTAESSRAGPSPPQPTTTPVQPPPPKVPEQLQPSGNTATAPVEAAYTTDATAAELQLPPQWEQLKNPETGAVYYFNHATGDSSWEPPAAVAAAISSGSTASAAVAAAGTPKGVVSEDEEDDDFVLVPDDDAAASSPGLVNATPSEEEEIVELEEEDDDDDDVVDETDQEPTEQQQQQEPPKDGDAATDLPLPDGWERAVDPSTGTAYYSNVTTGESSWDRPTAPATAADAQKEEDEEIVVQPTGADAAESTAADAVAAATNLASSSEWTTVQDPDSGNTYYYNVVTGETSWDLPPAATATTEEERSTDAVVANEGNDDNASSGRADGVEQKTVVVEQPQKEDKPVVDTAAAAERDSGAPIERTTTTTMADENGDNQEEKEALPPGWEKVEDPDSGNIYYYNAELGESSWDPPPPAASATVAEEEVHMAAEPAATDAAVPESEREPPTTEAGPVETLPPGWEKVDDPDSGNSYYYNAELDESSWDPPSGAAAAAAAPTATVEAQAEEPSNSGAAAAQEEPAVEPAAVAAVAAVDVAPESEPKPAKTTTASDDGDVAAVAGTPEPIGDAPVLPPGWEAVVDPDSGNTYYYNAETGDTRWDPPVSELAVAAEEADEPSSSSTAREEQAVEPAAADDVAPETPGETTTASDRDMATGTSESTSTPVLPPGWEEVVDPDSGNTYYHNAETGDTSWDPPAAHATVAAQADEPSSSGAAAEGDDAVEPADAAVADDVRPESETLPAVDLVGDMATGASGSIGSPVLPPGWEEVADPDSGSIYYHNVETDETSWDPPVVAPAGEAGEAEEPLGSGAAAEEEHAVEPADAVDVALESETAPAKTTAEDDGDMAAGTSELTGAPVLPPGWEEVADPDSGSIYYHNVETGETSWDPPAALAAAAEAEEEHLVEPTGDVDVAVAAESEPTPAETTTAADDGDMAAGTSKSIGAPVLPPGWEEVADPDSGSIYYYNPETGDTSWDPPVAPAAAAETEEPSSSGAAAAEEEEEHTVEQAATAAIDVAPESEPTPGETTTATEDGDMPAGTSESIGAPVLPPGWEEVADPDSGSIYYYNTVTGDTSWDPPVAPAAVAETEEPSNSDAVEEEHAVEPAAIDVVPESEPALAEKIADGDGDMAAGTSESIGAPVLPPGWEEVADPDSGGIYYYNTETGDTSWDPPVAPAAVAGTEEPSSSGAAAAEEEGEHTVERAATAIDVAPESEPAPAETTANQDEDGAAGVLGRVETLPPGWEKVDDPDSGTVYYYNAATGASSWDPPATVTGGDEPSSSAAAEEEPVVEAADVVPESETSPVVATAGDGLGSLSNKDETLPQGWEEVVDPDSGGTYYYNVGTGETAWELPRADAAASEQLGNGGAEGEQVTEPAADAAVESEIPEETNGSKTLPPGWEEVVDPDSGEKYYYNAVTDTTSWEPPESPAASEEHSSSGVSDGQHAEREAEDAGTGGERQTPLGADEAASTLLPGWDKVVDPDSGEVYYYNAQTEETSWNPPLATPASQAKAATGEDVTSLGPNEEPKTDASVASSESTQGVTNVEEKLANDEGGTAVAKVAPSGDEAASKASEGEPALPPGWEKVVDPVDPDNTYYYNEETGSSSWDLPQMVEAVPAAPVEGSVAIADPAANVPVVPTDTSEGDGSATGLEAESANDDTPLPTGWEKVVDPDSGDTYFYNEASGETAWEPPSVASTVAKQEEPANSAGSSSNDVAAGTSLDDGPPAENNAPVDVAGKGELSLPSGWEQVDDPDSGSKYYYNTETGETVWDPPTVAVTGGAEEPPSNGAAEGESVVDQDKAAPSDAVGPESVGPTVSSNATTENMALCEAAETAQDQAKLDEGTSASPERAAPLQVNEPDSQLPAGWEKIEDPDSGERYYYNEATGETSWELPASSAAEPADAGIPLSPGWERVVDPDSGQAYYYNAETGDTSWEAPSTKIETNDVQVENLNAGRREQRSAGRPGHAIATFGFRGRLCVVRQIPQKKAIVAVLPTKQIISSDSIVRVENLKKQAGFSGPLSSADERSVTAFVQGQESRDQGLLWNLVAISAKSRGRLRCDSRLDATDGPETAIIDLLLEAKANGESVNGNSPSPARRQRKEADTTSITRSEEADLEAVQKHLLRGEREKAVEVALAGGQFALALLVASMCSRETYYAAAKRYADSVLMTSSPLHTAAMLFCGPEKVASSSLWDGDVSALRHDWRSHLAAIISNRTDGWDQIVVSLGDRLRNLGEVDAAHFCYMICGCSLSPPVLQESRMTLLGCDVGVSPLDVLLMTNNSVESFARTEAYEWAKRRGNRNATIQSLQPFKLQYAMLLCDLGLVVEAKDYADSIMKNRSVAQVMRDNREGTLDCRNPAFLSIITSETNSLLSHLLRFRRRLDFHETEDVQYWGPTKVAEMEDMTFVTAKSTEDDPLIPEPSHPPKEVQAKSSKKSLKGDKVKAKKKSVLQSDKEPRPDQSKKQERGQSSARSRPSDKPHSITEEEPNPSFLAAQPPPTTQTASRGPTEEPKLAFPAVQQTIEAAEQPPTQTTAPTAEDVPIPSFRSTEKPPAIQTTEPKQTAESPGYTSVQQGPKSTGSIPLTTSKKASKVGTIPPFTPKEGPGGQNEGPKDSTPKVEPPGSSKLKQAPTSAPANLQSTPSRIRGMFDFGIKDRITKILNPNATQADPGLAMEAYFDEKRKVWVFPGEDPDELAKPVGPPPTAPVTEEKQPPSSAPATSQSNDPLAAMMAPPMRTPRLGGSSTMQPGRLPSAAKSPVATMPPPQFAVFQPKPASEKEAQGEDK